MSQIPCCLCGFEAQTVQDLESHIENNHAYIFRESLATASDPLNAVPQTSDSILHTPNGKGN